MKRHEWHETLDEGGQRFWRANFHAGRWTLMHKTVRRGSWETIKAPSEEDWGKLRDTLWDKYQRKRCPYKLVVSVDKILGRTTDEGSNS